MKWRGQDRAADRIVFEGWEVRGWVELAVFWKKPVWKKSISVPKV